MICQSSTSIIRLIKSTLSSFLGGIHCISNSIPLSTQNWKIGSQGLHVATALESSHTRERDAKRWSVVEEGNLWVVNYQPILFICSESHAIYTFLIRYVIWILGLLVLLVQHLSDLACNFYFKGQRSRTEHRTTAFRIEKSFRKASRKDNSFRPNLVSLRYLNIIHAERVGIR